MKVKIEIDIREVLVYPYNTVEEWEAMVIGLLADNGIENSSQTVRIEK